MSLGSRARIGCGSEELAEYAAWGLAPERASAWERHLAACARCRFDLAETRRVRSLLSSGLPSVPGGLRGALLELAAGEGDRAEHRTTTDRRRPEPSQTPRAGRERAGGVVPVPSPLQRFGAGTMAPLAVLPPTSPPVHRSALRSGVIAAAVLGASVASVWGLGFVAAGAVGTAGPTAVVHPQPGSGPREPGLAVVTWRLPVATTGGAASGHGTAQSTP